MGATRHTNVAMYTTTTSTSTNVASMPATIVGMCVTLQCNHSSFFWKHWLELEVLVVKSKAHRIILLYLGVSSPSVKVSPAWSLAPNLETGHLGESSPPPGFGGRNTVA